MTMQNVIRTQGSVFISHASAEKPIAEFLYDELKHLGAQPWMATKDVKAGSNYAQTIMHALQTSSAVIVLLTDSSISSQHVKREINLAIDKDIPIIPLNLTGKSDLVALLPADWQYWLTIVQILECDDIKQSSRQVVDALVNQGLAIKSTEKKPEPHSKNYSPNITNKKSEELEAQRERSKAGQQRKVEQDREIERQKKAIELAEKERILKEERERKEKEEAAKLAEAKAIRAERERKAREEAQKKASENRRKTQAAPRIKGAIAVVEWLREVVSWLDEINAARKKGVTVPENLSFYLDDFEVQFDDSFKVDLNGIEDLASDVRRDLAIELTRLWELVALLVEDLEELSRVTRYLDMAESFGHPYAIHNKAEWFLQIDDIEKLREITFGKDIISQIKRIAGNDPTIDITELLEKWKWIELTTTLAVANPDETVLRRSLRIIEEVIDNPETRSPAAWNYVGVLIALRLGQKKLAKEWSRRFESRSLRDARQKVQREWVEKFEHSHGKGRMFYSELLYTMNL